MKRLGAFFDRIAEHFREIRINIQDVFGFLIGKTGIGFQPGPKAERKAILTRVFVFVGIIVFITILLIIGIPWIKYYIVEIFTDLTLWLGIRKAIKRVNQNAIVA